MDAVELLGRLIQYLEECVQSHGLRPDDMIVRHVQLYRHMRRTWITKMSGEVAVPQGGPQNGGSISIGLAGAAGYNAADDGVLGDLFDLNFFDNEWLVG